MERLFLNENVEFVAGRNFKMGDGEFTVGDPVPRELVLRQKRVEALVRGRYLIPVMDDHEERMALPKFLVKEVKSRDATLAKLKVEDKREKPPTKKAAAKKTTKKAAAKKTAKTAAKEK